VLLWAGGLDSLPATDTAVLVLYGRGRRLGPALTGSQLTEAAVLRRLQAAAGTWDTAVDRAWQRGPAVPLAWDAGVRAAAVSALAFDPEDALVRAEVGQLFERTAHAPAPVVPVPVAEVKRVPPPAPQPAAATSPAAAVLPSHGAGGGFLEPWILGSGIAGVLLFGLLYRWMSRPARR
jgi:hypothetical protein